MATRNQIEIAKRVAEKVRKGEKVSISRIMKESGLYSERTSKIPGKITKSKSWPELMEKYLPDKKLSTLHKKFLEKRESFIVSDGSREGSHIEMTEQPHTDALKALELSYKLKGRLKEQTTENKTLVLMISGESAQRYGLNTSPNTETSSE